MTTKVRKCPTCGKGRLRNGESVEEYEFGSVTFKVTVPASVCSACGEALVAGPDLQRAELAVAAKVAALGLVSAETFRFMRAAVGLKGLELARLLQVTPESLSRWENGKREVDRSAWILLADLVIDHVAGTRCRRERLEAMATSQKLPKTVRVDLDATH